MLKDGFKASYTTIPFAIYIKRSEASETSFVTHHHKEIEIISMLRGGAEFTVNSTTHTVKQGDLLIIPPYSLHRARIEQGTVYNCICFDLSLLWDEVLAHELESGAITVSGPLPSDGVHTAQLCRHVAESIAAYNSKRNGWEMEVIGHMSLIFARLCENGVFVKSGEELKETAFCKSVIDYVKEHYREPITSTTAAEELYLNNSYFCRLFKKTFKCNFSDFVNEYRLERAKVLLYDKNMSVSDVAVATGFNSFSYFCKLFRATAGMSPTDYRRGA